MTTLTIPVPQVTMTGKQFAALLAGASISRYEQIAHDTLVAGHVPDRMRLTVDVTTRFVDSQHVAHTLTLGVLSDYLSIGTNEDALRVPLFPGTAQHVADAWECMLPTTMMSDIIWHEASNKMQPLPWGPPYDQSMMSTARIVAHDARVTAQMRAAGCDPNMLTAGHKKDVVMTNKLMQQPKQVAIFGWHQLNGIPIQPLYLGHENLYRDYSHGIRLVFKECILDGLRVPLTTVLGDQNLCGALSHEGPLIVLRQPGI